MTQLDDVTNHTDTRTATECPPWCAHEDICALGAHQGAMRMTTATAAMPTDIELVPEVPHLISFLLQNPQDPAGYVCFGTSDGPTNLRLHEVRTLIAQLQQHVDALEGGAR